MMGNSIRDNKAKKKKRIWFVAILFVLCFCGCAILEDDEEDIVPTGEITQPINSREVDNSNSRNTVDTSEAISKFMADGVVRDKKVTVKGDGSDTVTVLIYMNGSNLETDDHEATTDLSEMVAAGASDKVNVLVMTTGTKKWDNKYGIASDRSQIYKVDGNGLTLVKDNLGQLDCTESETLRDFITWGAQTCPANRYILQFWNHGGGPVYGFGYDEWNSDENAALTLDEIQTALREAGVYFDWVGMDCCLMSCLETCIAFYDYCDYMILSEDFESGLGWSYTNWLKQLYNNTSIDTPTLGKIICDDMVYANENDRDGDRSIMAVIDQSKLKVLFKAWTEFAYSNEESLLKTNYSRSVKRSVGGRVLPILAKARPNGWNYDFYGYGSFDEAEEYSMAEYFVTDIMEVAGSINSEASDALSAAISSTLIYVKSTQDDAGLTGIAVSLPYGDNDYYQSLKGVFSNIGIDAEYVAWLQKFTGVTNSVSTSTHDSWDDSWDGWENYDDDYDWSDWEYYDYNGDWFSDYDWSDFDYYDSWNYWYEDNSEYYDYDGGWDYQGDDWWYYDDEDWYWDDEEDWWEEDWWDYDWYY